MYLHGPNGAVRWQIENFAVEIDPQGNVKPSKLKAGDKIDAVVAAIVALSRVLVHAPSKKAAYLGSA
jgi:phage terminase large subunit-like protein